MKAPLTDGILVNRAAGGDAIAFSELVARHLGRVTAAALLIVETPTAADLCVQRAFSRVHGELARCRSAWDFYARLYRKLLMLCLAQRAPAGQGGGNALGVAQPLQQVLQQMPAHHHATFVLRECAGFTYHQISQILYCRVRTVARRLTESRERLTRFADCSAPTGARYCERGP